MTIEDIEALMQEFRASGLETLVYEKDGEKLRLKAGSAATGQEKRQNAEEDEKQPAFHLKEETRTDEELPKNETTVTAPLAGVFYRASKPEEKPFVEVGQTVKKGETIGLMEAMKMLSEIPAPCDGVIKEIPAENAAFVQFGAKLMTIGAE